MSDCDCPVCGSEEFVLYVAQDRDDELPVCLQCNQARYDVRQAVRKRIRKSQRKGDILECDRLIRMLGMFDRKESY